MDTLKINKITKKNNRIDYEYEVTGCWQKVLKPTEKMFLEYDENIENVPDSIAVIPLLCNILPISWIYNLNIEVSSIDKVFLNSIPKIKKGYEEMYPTIEMNGSIETKEVVENVFSSKKVCSLFSGGVDAFNTLFKHIDENPELFTVWGADVKLNDEEGWNVVKTHNIAVAKKFNLSNLFVKTNFRDFINYKELSNFVRKKVDGGEWWHEFQHGIGMLGLAAPICYIKKISTIYIASSFTAEFKGQYTCASDPTIDNNLKFASCKVVHDSYEDNRQDKIRNICEYVSKNNIKSLALRVCWITTGGSNCCKCEKCYRTILGLIAEKANPNKFGFELTEEKRKLMMKKLPKYAKYNFRYGIIQNRFIENFKEEETPKDLIWLRNIKIKNTKPLIIKIQDKVLNFLKRVINKIKRILS